MSETGSEKTVTSPTWKGNLKRLGQGWIEAASFYCEWRLILVFLMGFASGLPFLLSGATLSIWLTEAGVSLTAIGLFALVGTPYNLKFLWAPLVDRLPIPLLSRWLGRRRAWMVMIQVGLMGSIVMVGLSNPVSSPMVTAVCALAVAFFSASQDIVIDAYRIEILDENQQGAGAAVTQAGYRFGLLAAGAGALYLATDLNWTVVYAVMACLVLVGFVTALRAPIPESDRLEEGRGQGTAKWLRTAVVEPFVEFFQRNNVGVALLILAFILLYKFGDAFAGVMANPFYIKIGFTKAEIATVSKIFGVGATLLGVFVGGLFVRKYGILYSLLYCGLLQMFSNLMFAAQASIGPNVKFLFLTIGIENLSGGMGSAAFVAYLSILSAGSGWIADQTSWVTFFIISTFVAIPGLLVLLGMLKRLPMSVQAGRKPDS
jgi:PAT family beta-lactamase induction signal transducer AmpG